MKRTAPIRNMTPIRLGKVWLFADGRKVPVVSGGDGDEGAPVIPPDLSLVEPDELDALEAQLVAEFDRLHDEGSTDVAAFEAIAAGLDQVRAEQDKREADAAEAAEKIAAIRDRVHPAASDDGTPEGDDGDEGGDDPGDGAGEGGDGGEGAAAEPKELVTASASRPARASASATSRRAPRPRVTNTEPRVSITAAADLPGVTTNSEIDLTQVAVAMHDRARTLSDRSARVPVATIHRPFAAEDMITPRMSAEAALEIMDRAAAPRSAESLVAAGWCTPSQNMYELLALDGATGLLDVPSVGIERGGVNVPSYIGIDSADGALWSWSEAQDSLRTLVLSSIAVTSAVGTANSTVPHLLAIGDLVTITGGTPADGPRVVTGITDADTFTFNATGVADFTTVAGGAIRQKSCFSIPCPTWTDYRLTAYGLCLSHGNLTDKAFPELTRRYVQLSLNAHLHRMSSINIAKILTAANTDAVTISAAGSDSYGELMSAIELSIVDYRSRYKISDRVVVEVLLPSWTRDMLRSNLAMRAGVDMLAITDARLDADFAVRNTRPQFLEDYQAMWDGSAATAWPASIQFVIYAAGTFIEGNGGKIDLGVLRDSRLNATNDFTAAWTEDFDLLARRGPKGVRVTATLSTDGITACCP